MATVAPTMSTVAPTPVHEGEAAPPVEREGESAAPVVSKPVKGCGSKGGDEDRKHRPLQPVVNSVVVSSIEADHI